MFSTIGIISSQIVMPKCPVDDLSTNTLTNTQCLYSTKRLLTTYTNQILTVRRSSDNSSIDMYGDILGNLNTSGGTSLTSWLNGATCYVVKIFSCHSNKHQ